MCVRVLLEKRPPEGAEAVRSNGVHSVVWLLLGRKATHTRIRTHAQTSCVHGHIRSQFSFTGGRETLRVPLIRLAHYVLLQSIFCLKRCCRAPSACSVAPNGAQAKASLRGWPHHGARQRLPGSHQNQRDLYQRPNTSNERTGASKPKCCMRGRNVPRRCSNSVKEALVVIIHGSQCCSAARACA